MTHMKTKQLGFTVMEGVITLCLVTIVASIGVPTLRTLLVNNRLSVVTNELVSSLYAARQSALNANEDAVVCPLRDAEHCGASGDWFRGWLVFADRNSNGVRDNAEQIIQVVQRSEPIRISASRKLPIVYRADGMTEGSNTTVTVCDTRDGSRARKVVVSNTGRVRTEILAEGNDALCL